MNDNSTLTDIQSWFNAGIADVNSYLQLKLAAQTTLNPNTTAGQITATTSALNSPVVFLIIIAVVIIFIFRKK